MGLGLLWKVTEMPWSHWTMSVMFKMETLWNTSCTQWNWCFKHNRLEFGGACMAQLSRKGVVREKLEWQRSRPSVLISFILLWWNTPSIKQLTGGKDLFWLKSCFSQSFWKSGGRNSKQQLVMLYLQPGALGMKSPSCLLAAASTWLSTVPYSSGPPT